MTRSAGIHELCAEALALRLDTGASSSKTARLRSAAKWLTAKYEELNGGPSFSAEALRRVEAHLVAAYETGSFCLNTLCERRRVIADVEDLAEYGTIGRAANMSPWNRERNPLLRPVPDSVRRDRESIVGLSLAVLDEMRRTGYARGTLRDYELSALPRLVSFFKSNGTDRYSEELVEELVAGAAGAVAPEGSELAHDFLHVAALHVRSMHDEGRLHSRRDNGRWMEKAKDGRFGAIAAEFEQWCEGRGLKPKTVMNYLDGILPFLQALCPDGPGGLARMTAADVRSARSKVSEGRSPSFVNRTLTCLRTFSRFLADSHPDCPEIGPWLGPCARTVKGAPSEGYSPEQADAIVEAADPSTAAGKRDLAVLSLLRSTGLRACDVAALTLDDVDWRACEVNVVQAKTGVAVAVPLETDAGEAIAVYLLEARRNCGSRALFTTVAGAAGPLSPRAVSCIVAKYARLAGCDDISGTNGAHAFRRGLGAKLAAAEVPVADIADVMGHSSARSAMPYVTLATERLRACCAGLADIPEAGDGGCDGK